MNHIFSQIYKFFGSQLFFRVIVSGLVLGATWIALSGQYPMAFDEDFHLGLIRLYASHAWPFLHGQPANADAYGAVARDPSFLYHYLLSFPYRLISLITPSSAAQVLFLRALNIALFASCLPIFRRLLLRAGASPATANGCLALFVLLPITSLLAAQINYDNLLLPITAATLLVTLRVRGEVGSRRARCLLLILGLGLTGSLVKFAFLPIFIACTLWLAIVLRPCWRQPRQLLGEFWAVARTRSGAILVASIVVLLAFSVNRYGVNLVRYHDPIPDCGKVLSLQHCQKYGPYIRDYNFGITKSNHHTTPLDFSKEWLYGMWLRTMFTVDGPRTQYQTRGPFFVPAISVLVMLAVGLVACCLRGRLIWHRRRSSISLFILVTLSYVTALWLQEYKAFAHTGFPVAINGRYLLPIILLVMFIISAATVAVLRRHKAAKTGLLLVSLLALMWGGGALTYILRSNDSWYWNNDSVRQANHAVQRVLGPVTPGYVYPQAYLR